MAPSVWFQKKLLKYRDRFSGKTKLLNAIRSALTKSEYATAASLIESGQTRFKNCDKFSIQAARLELLQGNEKAASQQLSEARICDVQDSGDLLDLANSFRKIRAYDKSIACLNRIVECGSLEQRQTSYQSLATIHLRKNNPKLALHAALEGMRIGGWHHRYMISSLCEKCEPSDLRIAIERLKTFEAPNVVLQSFLESTIAYFSTAVSDWEQASTFIRKATKSSFETKNPNHVWDDQTKPLQPGVLVIGAMKSGSSALFNCLQSHPQFVAPQNKELHFFDQGNWPLDFYLNQFPCVQKTDQSGRSLITGEASPGYYALDIAHRIKKVLPSAKLILIKRDPVDRAISHFFHNQNKAIQEHSLESLTRKSDDILELAKLPFSKFNEAVKKIESGELLVNRFLWLGCYELLMRSWYAEFSKSQILEIEFDHFSAQPQEAMDQVFAFLNLEPFKIPELEERNSGTYQAQSKQLLATRRKLQEFYEEIRSIAQPHIPSSQQVVIKKSA